MSQKRRLSADGTKPLKFKKVKEEETLPLAGPGVDLHYVKLFGAWLWLGCSKEKQLLSCVASFLFRLIRKKASLALETSMRSNRLEQSQSIGEYMAAKFNSKDSVVVNRVLKPFKFTSVHFQGRIASVHAVCRHGVSPYKGCADASSC